MMATCDANNHQHGWSLPNGWEAGKPCFCGAQTLADPSEPSKDELIATLRARVQALEEELVSYESRRSDLMARYTAMRVRAEQAEETVQATASRAGQAAPWVEP